MKTFFPAFRLVIFALLLVFVGCAGCDPDNNVDPTPDAGLADDGTPDNDTDTPDMGGNDVDVTDMDSNNANNNNGDLFVFDFGDRDVEQDMGPVVLRVDAVLPPTGPLDGGTPIVVSGSGFTQDTVVLFGGRPAEVELIDGDLVGQSPPGQGPGAVNVKVLDPVMGEVVLEGGFEYTVGLGIDSILPNRVPSEGGVEVTIRGFGFDEGTRFSFGGETGVRHDFIDDTQMRVVVPPHAPGTFAVRVTNRNATTLLPGAIEYFEAVRVDSVQPATGIAAGGETVVVTGAGFDPAVTVRFNGAPATVVDVDPVGIAATVTTPGGTPGLVDVSATNPSGDADISNDIFYYAADAADFAIGTVHPSQGAAVGGTEVTVIGAGLDAATSVTFDGQPGTIVSQDAGTIVVQTPPHAIGVVDVAISDGSQTDTLAGGFEYVANLWIDRVMPDTGDVAGGYDVVIDGEGFNGVSNVAFDGIAAAYTIDTDRMITATAPAHSAGLVDVVVERNEVSARFRDAFTYTEPLEVYGMSPVRGSVAGGTYVEIRGRGFVGSPTVTFGGQSASDVTILDSQTLAVRTPPNPSGAVDVEVTVAGANEVAPLPYTYFNPGSRFGGAWGGPVAGAVNVTVFSYDGQPLEGAFVMLSTNPATPYQGLTDVNGMVTLSGPDVFGEQTVTATYNMFVEARPCNPEISWTSSATVNAIDAENITIFLDLDPPAPTTGTPPPEDGCERGTFECYCRASTPLCDDDLACNPFTGVCCPPPPEPPSEPSAFFTGFLSGLDKLAEPGPGEVPYGIVVTTQRDIFSQNPDPGDGNIVVTNGVYSLNSRIGDLALVAVGGLYNNSNGTFRPLRMGIERYLFAADGQTYNVDIDLNIPLDTPLSFKLNNPPNYPGGPTNSNEVTPYLDLGFEGVVNLFNIAEGQTDVVTADHQAALTGILADASYSAFGGSYNRPGLLTGGGYFPVPQTVAITSDITDTNQVVQMPGLVGIASVTSPVAGGRPTSNLIEWELLTPTNPDFFNVSILTPDPATGQLKQFWEVFLPGDARSVRLPDFPDFSALPQTLQPDPYLGGTHYLIVYGYEAQGFDYRNFSYSDRGLGEVRAYSMFLQTMSF